jgi:ubiquinone biosynthesis protein COQ9
MSPPLDRRLALSRLASSAAYDGWTDRALERTADSLGTTAFELKRTLGHAPSDRLKAYHALLTERMLESVREGFHTESIRSRVKTLVMARLEAIERDSGGMAAMRSACAFLARPSHAALGAKLLWDVADAVWRACGDKSTDFNYYSKRALLSGVYASTLLFRLSDVSEGAARTQEFLDRRIADAMRLGEAKRKAKAARE